MRLLDRLKKAFNPRSHDATLSHYISAPDFSNEPVMNSVWQSDLAKRFQDWKGDCGRVYNQQLVTAEGPLMFALKVVPTAGLGGTGIPFGQAVVMPATGFAGQVASPQIPVEQGNLYE